MSYILSMLDPSYASNLLYPAVYHVVRDIIMPIAQARDPERTGGWFVFYRRDPRTDEVVPVFECSVGNVSGDRFAKYQHFAREKAVRLKGQKDLHISSWQSRDASAPDKMDHKYGGAIWVSSRLILSFSGFSEHEDEAVCAIAAHRIELLHVTELNLIAETSDNQVLLDNI